jgi:hypothetical protein
MVLGPALADDVVLDVAAGIVAAGIVAAGIVAAGIVATAGRPGTPAGAANRADDGPLVTPHALHAT